jgi:hypothetical protein
VAVVIHDDVETWRFGYRRNSDGSDQRCVIELDRFPVRHHAEILSDEIGVGPRQNFDCEMLLLATGSPPYRPDSKNTSALGQGIRRNDFRYEFKTTRAEKSK